MSTSKRKWSGGAVGGSHEDPLARFLPAVQKWFTETVGTPSPPQVQAWPHIDSHQNVLVHAPTGSGKTLAAFLSAINRLFASEGNSERRAGIDTLYISPLKALNYDIERNLRLPLEGIRKVAAERGEELSEITAEVRTGDTPSAARARMVRRPPHILITTPESLYLLLTSPQARNILQTVRTVIVDEIHSLSGTKRGVHLALSLKRLEKLSPGFQRIGLSATQKPLEEVARFLGGQQFIETADGRDMEARPVKIIDAQFEKKLEVQVIGMPDREIGDDRASVWNGIIPKVLEDIRANRTTLVFANSRRQAERSADRLNAQLRSDETGTQADLNGGWAAANTDGENDDDLDGPFYAHHGSISDETRHLLEEALKAGELSALVGTSSLELGIDIGTVDLVVQLQSPKTVTQGLQRVGRSGHRVGETSRYRIYATHEEDLLESAVIARGMVAGDVEAVYTPQNALDVLSQQVVAAVASDDWEVDALFDLVRCAYPYHNLARSSFDGVLKLVSGKYPRHVFSTLRARVNWDETGGMLRALPGTRMHAVDNGGAIVDRGAFPVYLSDRKTRIGELDEEFVYETKEGDAFVLGSQVWRAADIDDDRVIVEPAPGAVPRMPFWRGEFPWRPLQLSETLAEFKSEIASRLEPFVDEDTDPTGIMNWLQQEYFCDEPAARQIVSYVRRQLRSTGDIASDRSLLIETYSDPIGDRRIVIHSPFGGKVNGPWSVALASVIKERTSLEPQVEVNDDGILFRLPDFDDGLIGDLLTAFDPEKTRERVLAGLSDSALYGALFRQNAQRALLLPGQRRGRRTPFWLQRLRSKDLLAASRGFQDFPVALETFRDCLEDAMDLPGLLRVIQAFGDGRISVAHHESAAPSPVARSLSYALEAWYMYQWDAPRAERSLQTLGLDRNQLAELMRDPSFAGTLRQEALDEVESQVAHTAPGRRARSATELAQLLEDLGDLAVEEITGRCDGMPMNGSCDWNQKVE
jgi:ATP-dependent Lhr-like helicase